MRWLPCLSLLVLAAAPLAAQEGQETPRQGFWFSIGPAVGSRGISCDICIGGGRESGISTSIRAGGTLSPGVTLGANLIGWARKTNDGSGERITVFSALLGVAQYYPVRGAGFFLQGGGGYIVDVIDDETVIEGVGLIVGTGYDVPIGRSVSLTPLANYVRMIDGGNLTSSLYQLGLAVTWH